VKLLILSHMYPNAMDPVSGIFVHEQAQELVRQGCEVKVVSPVPWSPVPVRWLKNKWGTYARIPLWTLHDGVEVYYPRYVSFPRAYFFGYSGWFYYLGIRHAVRGIYREFPFDIIHAHVALPDGYGALLANRVYQKPLVVTIHGLDMATTIHRNDRCRQCVLEVLEAVSRVVCVSSKLRKQCLGVYDDEAKFEIVSNGISPTKIVDTPGHLRGKYEGKKVLLTVGWLYRLKGHDYVIRALPEIIEKVPELVYLIVGSGPEEDCLKQLVDQLGLNDYVEFCGRKDHEMVMKYMSICDLFVMPSWDEGFGVVYLEAMAHGKPVIACRGQGIQDVIVGGETGLLVKPKDLESLKEAMMRLLTDRRLAKDMGRKGKQVVLSDFTWEKSAQKLMGIYREVLAEKR
jgi:teichuronic acid biosynthesis glycosyltransferase TuaC